MEFAMELWKPILIGGLAIFVVSALVWTVMPHHKKEWARLQNEDAVADAIRAGSPTPGLYNIPHMYDMAAMGTPEGKAKMERGPLVYLTVVPNGVPAMGPMMAKSALFNILVALFVAYVCWHTLAPGTEYLKVFRIAGTVAFMTCALGAMPESIWFGRPWKSFGLQVIDATMYALVLGGIFGWLWP